MKRVKIAVIGASGYTGLELLRLLLTHPHAELVCVTSRQNAGRKIGELFPRFTGAESADLKFIDPEPEAIAATGAEVAFLALPHGVAAGYASSLLEKGLRIIDLSADFRLEDPEVYKEFYGDDHPAPELLKEAVYGLPEVRRDAIPSARLIAAPGCYPTSISLPLIPLLREKLIDPSSIVTCSMSGVSGAGKKADLSLLFCECNESARAYGVPKHRHLSEIEQELGKAAGEKVVMSFTPHLIPVHNGICTTTSAKLTGTPEEVNAALETAYADEHFVRLLGKGGCADTKNVTGTNFIDIGWEYDERTGRVLLLSAEDNLGKGAGGQAVQNFNILCGFSETAGLQNF
ncbi:N-acetyl-gamma-glutamyl-phosphate reductase [Verrucomicrobiaceae bacterium R5-34]|uniref:N-acetyl-gamma-glutamyl-phosphate reductase n=1 Tax=Oceaniferula flava TaxID=2800421 RepID=A0AAE2SE99_9BACT|nr:N-acetyl-gamma-glutamyl-phosphate reductase [Oceaniferula flavus]MBK1831395.1 N-acetyl-gamma-glutamyl-phosphate reductase [Verrucomicrobiaceae bacterium R5-34]MBK1854935.1 N-acetyl-gamma-glutamyl-phosphate reductase [Oceaniferula flavus]MBM1136241.1 N-acetyl-gamma-glutamyl-phosphate reductase [Oceaniferula flavus]